MVTIQITGDEKHVKNLLKVSKGRINKYGLTVSFNEKKQEGEGSPANKESKLTANQVAELIAKCESIEDLKQYESDKRQVVSKAYEKKLKELSE